MKKFILITSLLFGMNAFCAYDISDYETVEASQTDQVLGPVGKAGDILETLIITPLATLSPGAVSIKDGSGSSITIFSGGASSLVDYKPIVVHVSARSVSGGWKVTTGASVNVNAIGSFH